MSPCEHTGAVPSEPVSAHVEDRTRVHRGLVQATSGEDKSHVRLTAPLMIAVNFALPPRCPGCSAIVDRTLHFCSTCWTSFDFLTEPACALCFAPMDYAIGEGALCGRCLADPPRHHGLRAAVAYGAIARTVLMRFKYGRRPALARLMASHLRRHFEPDADDVIVPVPLGRWRLWSRGYNQAGLIAASLRQGTDAVLDHDSLVRVRETPRLGKSGRTRRAKLLRGAFEVPVDRRHRIAGRTIWLIDDVYTSGSTANGCASALLKAGAAKVRVLAWAKVVGERD